MKLIVELIIFSILLLCVMLQLKAISLNENIECEAAVYCGLVYYFWPHPLFQHTDRHLFYSIEALCKYVHCQSLEVDVTDGAEQSTQKRAIYPLVTYVRLSHTQVDITVTIQETGWTHLCHGRPGHPGGFVSFIYHGWVICMNLSFVNDLLLMRCKQTPRAAG